MRRTLPFALVLVGGARSDGDDGDDAGEDETTTTEEDELDEAFAECLDIDVSELQSHSPTADRHWFAFASLRAAENPGRALRRAR